MPRGNRPRPARRPGRLLQEGRRIQEHRPAGPGRFPGHAGRRGGQHPHLRDHGGTQLGRRHARRQPMRTRAMVREVRQRAHRRQYPEPSHRLRPVSRTRRPRHAPTQHHTQRRKRMEGSDRRHQRITLSTKRTAGTIHRLPAVPLIGDPITKNDYFPIDSFSVPGTRDDGRLNIRGVQGY